MSDDKEPECYDLLEKPKSDHGDGEDNGFPNLQRASQHEQDLVMPESVHSNVGYFTRSSLSLKNIQYSRPPSKDICCLAVSTFEKMDISGLRSLEKLSDDLKTYGQIRIDKLKSFTLRIMTEVWHCDEKLEALLKSDPGLTEILGRELLVLFDNVMSDPIYDITDSSKPQRYIRACLDNSIQPVYDDTHGQSKWGTYETVISTYTSPTAFTPEMESLIKTAAQLGISTNDLNLKKFVTERSLSAFLKTLIQAKLRKTAFIKKFNSRLMGVLHHAPNFDDSGATNKFKYSLSKLYQFIGSKSDTKSSPDFHHSSIRGYLPSRDSRNRYSLNKGGLFANERERDFTIQRHPNGKKRDQNNTICNRCHDPYKEDCSNGRNLVKSMSDTYLSAATCESITCCQCFDTARKVWDKRSAGSKSNLIYSSKNGQKKKRSNLKNNCRPLKESKTPFKNQTEGFGLLTEQRSFFRLGEGALRDALTEYVEAKSVNIDGNRRTVARKKRVHWIDETSFSSFYGSMLDSESELLELDRSPSRISGNCLTVAEKILCFLLQGSINDSRAVALSETPLGRVVLQALLQATLVAVFFWICFQLYQQTPQIAKVLRQLGLGHWLQKNQMFYNY